MSTQEMEVVFDHLSAIRRRDIDGVAALLDPDVVHQGYTPELLCEGRDAVLSVVGGGMRRGQQTIERLELVDAGERVIVGVAGPQFRERQGPDSRGQTFIVFTIRGGLILRMDDFLTREEAFHAAGVTATDWA